MVASRLVKPLVVALALLEVDGVDEKNCAANLQGQSCQTTSVDVPPVGNGLFQSKFQRQNLQPSAAQDADHNSSGDVSPGAVASFASVSRTSLSQRAQTLQLRKAAAGVQMGMERMEASWDDSVSEINTLIGSIIDHESSSEDSCSTQLLEYKSSLTKIHESTTTIAVEVNSTASQIAIYDKVCKEKNEELNEIEVLERKKIRKCVTERSVQTKTLETLRYDMQEMQHISRAHIHLQAGASVSDRFPTHRHALLETDQELNSSNVGASLHEPPSHERVANVKSMVQKTKDMASKVSTCMAKAKLAGEASLIEESASQEPDSASTEFTETSANETSASVPPGGWQPQDCSDLPKPRCLPVSCGSDGWVCGAIEQCSGPHPMCHPLSCVQGQWQCGEISGPEYSACDGKNRGDACGYPQFEAHPDPRIARSSPPLMKGKCGTDRPFPMLAETENEVYSFLEEDMETSPVGSQRLKCMPDNAPTECKEIVVELEHQFTVSYVSLTRMIEEYEVVTHSTVCEETVHETYIKQSSAVQDEANKVCSDVQLFISKLEKYKFEYQSSTKTEYKMETTIRNLIKQCGSLTSTETYLEDVQDTLGALGSCPGIGDVTFHLPTWVGEWAKFDQDRQKSDSWNDKQMAEVCSSQFGYGARPAEVSEIDSQGVEGMPSMNTAEYPVLGACPMCRGKQMPGLTLSGNGRVCWDGGAPFSRFGRRKDCGGGPRNVMCVYDGAAAR